MLRLPEMADKQRSLEIELDMLRGEVSSLRARRVADGDGNSFDVPQGAGEA